jgi:hypothetical protein
LHETVSKLVHTISINKVRHKSLHCNIFTVSRIIMLFKINKLNLIWIPVNIDLLLFGNETLSCDVNCSIFLAVQKYIKDTFCWQTRPPNRTSMLYWYQRVILLVSSNWLHIMTLLIKTMTSVLNVSSYIITSITASPIVIMSIPTFQNAIILIYPAIGLFFVIINGLK